MAEALSKHPTVLSIGNMSFVYRPLSPIERSEGTEEDELDESVGKLVNALEDDIDTVAVFTTRG